MKDIKNKNNEILEIKKNIKIIDEKVDEVELLKYNTEKSTIENKILLLENDISRLKQEIQNLP